ncbi:hypothetical protein GF337_10975, partial [candidate division KSB1 bacterium]|nr:hypothetical protein [candidate division KSB1 bacterium]
MKVDKKLTRGRLISIMMFCTVAVLTLVLVACNGDGSSPDDPGGNGGDGVQGV